MVGTMCTWMRATRLRAFAAIASLGLLTSTPAVLAGCTSHDTHTSTPSFSGAFVAKSPRVCSPEIRSRSVYIADWPAPLRAELEVAMSHGAVLLRLTCEGIAIVRGCTGPGLYEEASIGDASSKLWSARDDDAGGNLPLRGAALERQTPAGGSLVLGALERSRRSLAMPRGTAELTTSDELGNVCAGATHIVTTVHDGEVILARRASRKVDLPMSSNAPDPTEIETLVHTPKAPFQIDLVPLSAHRQAVDIHATTSLYPGAASETSDADPDAGCKLGLAMSCTRSATRSTGAAASAWLDRACHLGEVGACERLGVVLLDSDPSGPLDTTRARSALERACTARDALACARIGVELDEGKRVPKDFPLAVKSLEIACREGDVTSCFRGAQRLAKWGNDDRDDQRANAMFERACGKGEGIRMACYELGRRFASGQAGLPDLPRAAELYLLGCAPPTSESINDEDNHACARAGVMYETGDGVKKDFDRGMELHMLACKRTGDKRSCLAAGNWLEKRSHGRGTALYQEVCRRFKLREACQRALLP